MNKQSQDATTQNRISAARALIAMLITADNRRLTDDARTKAYKKLDELLTIN